MRKKLSLKDEIHKIQNGIENVHGDVAYGERQYLFLFKKYVLWLLGEDLPRNAFKTWVFKLHEEFIQDKDQPEVTLWMESHEFTRGFNSRAITIREKLGKLIKGE